MMMMMMSIIKKSDIGGYGKYETRLYADEEGAPTHPKEGGRLPDSVATVTTKFNAEARGCFGEANRRKYARRKGNPVQLY